MKFIYLVFFVHGKSVVRMFEILRFGKIDLLIMLLDKIHFTTILYLPQTMLKLTKTYLNRSSIGTLFCQGLKHGAGNSELSCGV